MEPVGWEVEMEGPLEKGVERAAAALKEEGFGILDRKSVV